MTYEHLFGKLKLVEPTWDSIDADVTQIAAAFDPSRITVTDAADVVSRIGVIEAKLYAVKARAAARAAEAGATIPTGPRGRGHGPARSAAEALATRNGTSVREADRLLRTGQQLEEQPDLLGAAQSGELSPTQVELISDAAKDAPDQVGHLVDKAKATSISGLRDECAAAKAAADPDPDAAARRAHAARRLALWTREQVGKFFGQGSALQNAWLMAALEPVRAELRAEARRRGETVTEEMLSYDALMLLVSRGLDIDLPLPDDAGPGLAPDEGSGAGDVDDPGSGLIPRSRGPRRPGGPPGSAAPSPKPSTAEPALDPQSALWSTKDYGRAGDSPSATRWSSDGGEMPEVDPLAQLWRPGDATTTERIDDDVLEPWTRDPAAGGVGIRGPSAPGSRGPTPGSPSSGNASRNGKRTAHRKWSKAHTIIRVDSRAAARGRPAAGEVCELTGSGPITIGDVETVLAQGSRLSIVSTRPDGMVDAVAHVRRDRIPSIDIRDPEALEQELARSGRPVADVVHEGRRPTAYQLTALQWVSPTCTVEGCSNATCDVDHEIGYAVTRNTRIGDLDPLCRYHHRMKTIRGWALVAGHGKRAFVAPDDPDHPGSTR